MSKIRKKQISSANKSPINDDDNDEDEIEAFYQQRDENLRNALSKTPLKKPMKGKKSVSWALDAGEEGDNEVLAFDDDSMSSNDDNDYAEIDQDDDDDDDDLTGAWGTSKKVFYNEDANDDDEDAKLEEQEAVHIQKKYYDMLEKKDLGLELFKEKPTFTVDDKMLDEQSLRRHIILPDNLLELSSNERLQLIRDQSPELETLCNEFKTIFDDLKIYILPFVQLVLDTSSLAEFQAYSGWTFVLGILELYLVYCSYLSLYLMMKSSETNLFRHPILNDIEQYRKLTQLVDDDFQAMKNDLLKLRELLHERKSQQNRSLITDGNRTNGVHIIPKSSMTNGTKKKVSLRERMAKRKQEKVEENNVPDEVQEENDEPKKRAITYQIQKNKGLTAKRKKEYRNPRVRNRNKYARALVKRKSRIPTARSEEEKYTGEPTGIRAGLKRGVKLKC